MALRVLYVDNSLRSFFAFRSELVQTVQDIGCEVHIAAPPDGALSVPKQRGLQFHPIRMSRQGLNPLTELSAIGQLRRLYTSLRPDLIHHCRLKPVLYGGIAGRLTGAHCSVHLITGLGHAFIETGFSARILRTAIMSACRWISAPVNTRVIFQNVDDMNYCLRINAVRSETAILIRGSGVNTRHFAVVDEVPGTPVVVMPSRMLKDKGVYSFVEAARLLKARSVDCRMVLVGDSDPGNPSTISTAELEGWNATGVIEWWGYKTDMASVFRSSHIVCLPSLREGLPKSLLEGASCGRPIVATNVPGCRDVVKHGCNGYLVPVNDPTAIAEALETLVTQPTLRHLMGLNGRARVLAEFSVERVIAETIDVYRSLLHESLYPEVSTSSSVSRPMSSAKAHVAGK